jgi:5-methylcytosine-specific restriction protein B
VLTDTQQPLIERIRDIGQPEAVRRFFNLLKELIDIINLPNGDARLAFVSEKERTITANINYFSALRIFRPYGGEIEYGLTIKKDCQDSLSFLDEVNVVPLTEKSEYVSIVIGHSNVHLIDNPTLHRCWADSLLELAVTSKRGPHVLSMTLRFTRRLKMMDYGKICSIRPRNKRINVVIGSCTQIRNCIISHRS